MDFYIGVDAGADACRAAVTRKDGPILGVGTAGPANFAENPVDTITNMRAAMSRALGWAALSNNELARSRVHAGVVGVRSEHDAMAVARALGGSRTVVTNTLPTLAQGVLPPGDGAMVVIGRSAYVAARQGASLRSVGGWGLPLSDHGSRPWLGRALLQEVVMMKEGMAETSQLLREVGDRTGDPADLSTYAHAASLQDLSNLGEEVVRFAEMDDEGALALMARGAEWIRKALTALEVDPTDPVCLTGGIGTQYARHLPDLNIVKPRGTALDGAVALVRRR